MMRSPDWGATWKRRANRAEVLDWERGGELAEYVVVAKVADFREDIVRVFEVGDEDVAVVSHGGRFYAFQGHCTHAAYSFNYTRVRPDEQILCSSHFAWFDLATGKVLSGPAGEDLAQYDVRVQSGELLVCNRPASS